MSESELSAERLAGLDVQEIIKGKKMKYTHTHTYTHIQHTHVYAYPSSIKN